LSDALTFTNGVPRCVLHVYLQLVPGMNDFTVDRWWYHWDLNLNDFLGGCELGHMGTFLELEKWIRFEMARASHNSALDAPFHRLFDADLDVLDVCLARRVVDV